MSSNNSSFFPPRFWSTCILFIGLYITTNILLSSCHETPKSSDNTKDQVKEIDMSSSGYNGSLTYKIVEIRGIHYYASRTYQGDWILGGQVKVADGK